MKNDSDNKSAILVLGMHRSGTSLATGLMEMVGVDLPEDLMEPTSANPKGYWESKSLMAIHDQILATAHMQWSDAFFFDEEWYESESYSESKRILEDFIQSHFESSGFFALKDPRMCRLAPLWFDVLASKNIDARVVIPVRHPSEVVSSLQVRDNLAADAANFLWLRHVLEAELASREIPRSFSQYTDLLNDPNQTLLKIGGELEITWPSMGEAALKAIDDLVDPSLRHHAKGTESIEQNALFSPLLVKTYKALELLCSDAKSSAAMKELDQVRKSINQADGLYEPVIREQQRQKAKTFAELDSQESKLKNKEAEIQELSSWASSLQNSKEKTETQNQALLEKTAELEGSNRSLSGELASAHHKITEVESIIADERSVKQELGISYFRMQRILSVRKRAFYQKPLRVVKRFLLRKKKNFYVEPLLKKLKAEFDHNYYRKNNPDLSGLSADQLLDHYVENGWKEHRKPSVWFDTEHYLQIFPELRNSNLCPLYHFIRYGLNDSSGESDYLRGKLLGYMPEITAIVPNFNHADFLQQRLGSITSQTHPPSEIIILDDCSTDDSLNVIEELVKEINVPVKVLANETNSGNVFKQWRKGIEQANHDLIWICESDDFCELSFLEKITPYFADSSIKFAFGNIQFANTNGDFREGMNDYRSGAQSYDWTQSRVDSAHNWFNQALGQRNVAANVGGCVFRKQNLDDETWGEAEKYSVCGDWYLYMHLSLGGRIAYEPSAVAYFRQHDRNTSVTSFQSESYYAEHAAIASELRSLFGNSDAQTYRFYDFLKSHFESQNGGDALFNLEQAFEMPDVLEKKRESKHILMGILGFSTGGGELVPINLANELVSRGHQVSVVTVDSKANEDAIRKRLDARIAVYERELVDELGLEIFLSSHGFDLIHTHFLGLDLWMHKACKTVGLPYVVTHHGSYDCQDIEKTQLESLLGAVTHWVYIAEKNLNVFDGYELIADKVTKLPNAVPASLGVFRLTREDLGISNDAFVFGLASRALHEKGWDIAADALLQLREKFPEQNLHLLFCGTGRDYDELRSKYGKQEFIQFLGYQDNVIGFYELCDCCVFPTRFKGESYPLTLIENMMAGRPSVATDIGEISNILGGDDSASGLLVDYSDDDKKFLECFVSSMEQMLDEKLQKKIRLNAEESAKKYSMASLAEQYEGVYKHAHKNKAAS